LASLASLPAVRASALVCLLLSVLSCKSLERFDTKDEAAYCGTIVAGPSFHDGFIESEQPPDLRLRLTLDTSQIGGVEGNRVAVPGRLTSSDGEAGLCAEQALFSNSLMRTIPQIYHDSLSTLTFGEGHEEHFFAWVDSTCQGTMLALVSLLNNGNVELRLFKPASLPSEGAGPTERPGYALFYLTRSEDGCGF
jgi:hypothetical protein